MLNRYSRPVFFYGLSLLIPWALWFTAAYLSHLPDQTSLVKTSAQLLGLIGLIAPTFVVIYLMTKDRGLLMDVTKRFLPQPRIAGIYYLYTLGLIFVSLVIAQCISVAFGHSLDQFHISGNASFSSAVYSPWFILVFAPIAEELAWHSYGTDTLRRKFNLFATSMIFAVYWVFWHLPLAFIKGYYHANVVAEGLLYSLNFVFSLFVLVIIMNWLYYKTGRNIVVKIVFHLTANISNEMFATHPDSKVIQTVLLLAFTVVILVKDRKMFFSNSASGVDDPESLSYDVQGNLVRFGRQEIS